MFVVKRVTTFGPMQPLCVVCSRPIQDSDRDRCGTGVYRHRVCPTATDRRQRPRGQFNGTYPNWNRHLKFVDHPDGSK